MEKVYDNVNYDYPACGGYQIYKNTRKQAWSVRQYSNYQGDYTHRYWLIPMDICANSEATIELIRLTGAEDYITRRGFIVQ